jgi:acyl-coenzyme A synthetase/AMP-(fatty) acid ligase
VAILARSKIRCLTAFLAINRIGAAAVTLHLGASPQTLVACVEDTHPDLILADAEGRGVLEALRIELPTILLIDRAQASGKTPALDKIETIGEDECCVLFSSGSTGRAKGIERDFYSMTTESLGWCLELSLSRRTKFYIGRPIYYTGGLVLALAMLTVGGGLVFCDLIDDNSFLDAWRGLQHLNRAHTLDLAFFIPDQLRFFVERAKEELHFEPNPIRILTMGAPISGAEKQQVAKALRCGVLESWGNSESLGTITDDEDLALRPDSIGRPFLTDELFVVDDSGAKLGPQEVGRIAGHIEAGFTRYSKQPDATADTIVDDMIISDDIGKMDASGHFYILGRMADLIHVGEQPTTLPKIETLIRDAEPNLVFGAVVLSDSGGNATVGILIERGTEEEWFAARKKVEEVYPSLTLRRLRVESLPRLPSGKLDRIRAATMFAHAR